ncbi:regulator [Leptolyngbya sp. 'hensonii']|uniref:PP2C family protein-serine/threonine phosphatase n=1 Tax=Leptolyngbya sp. 'hensonii' TaxID=1922337 RepID=UPI00094F8AB5|nr:SpoIIE family protein phosphatase [Leptolyngbya sp. 'hensonii']OLP15780.1 regulator [Leptolyngbya sp. 'hensonii']
MAQILVIDDDPVIQLVLKQILQNQGYEVAFASTGELGLTLARETQPELIICDWMLPGIDGLEVCQQIRQDPLLTSVFFILLTARGTVAALVQALDAGADEFLSKPIDQNELKARVRAGLRLYQSNQVLQLQKQQLSELNQVLQTQKQLLEQQLSEAANYVQSILPRPIETPLKIESRYVPSMQLGGDCFDYFWLDPDFLAIYLLDTSGHGVGSALLSISVFNLIRSQSLDEVNFYHPSTVLTKLNQNFRMSEQGFKYFTLWYGVYDLVNRQLIYAGGGHPPALLLTGTEAETQVVELKSQSMPVGLFTDTQFTNSYCKVEPGSELYIFSDGIYEVKQSDGNLVGLPSFVDLVRKLRSDSSLNLDWLLNQIQDLGEKPGYEDDVSLLKISFD